MNRQPITSSLNDLVYHIYRTNSSVAFCLLPRDVLKNTAADDASVSVFVQDETDPKDLIHLKNKSLPPVNEKREYFLAGGIEPGNTGLGVAIHIDTTVLVVQGRVNQHRLYLIEFLLNFGSFFDWHLANNVNS